MSEMTPTERLMKFAEEMKTNRTKNNEHGGWYVDYEDAHKMAEAMKVLANELVKKCMCYGPDEPQAVRNPCPSCEALESAAKIVGGEE